MKVFFLSIVLIFFSFSTFSICSIKAETYFEEDPENECVKIRADSPNQCESIEHWKQISIDRCRSAGNSLTSFYAVQIFYSEDEICDEGGKYRNPEFLCCSSMKIRSSYDDDDDLQANKASRQSISFEEPESIKAAEKLVNEDQIFQDDQNTANRYQLIFSLQPENVLSEHERFSKAKSDFRQRYQQSVENLKSSWQKNILQIQKVAEKDKNEAQKLNQEVRKQVEQNYKKLLHDAHDERRKINEAHERKLDAALSKATSETRAKLEPNWNNENIEELKKSLKNYVSVLLRDRIHLVNRYERLRVVEKLRAEFFRDEIHQRLKTIELNLDEVLKKLSQNEEKNFFIRPEIDQILDEYKEVNDAARRLVFEYEKDQNRLKFFLQNVRKPTIDDQIKPKTNSSWFSSNFVLITTSFSSFLTILLLAGIIFAFGRTRKSKKIYRTSEIVTKIDESNYEEKHLQHLQSNGFENPTYKLLEKQSLI